MSTKIKLPKFIDLTTEQQETIKDKNPITVFGGVGTGKSVISIWRHIRNLEELNKKSYLITFTHSLTFYFRNAIKQQSLEASKYIINKDKFDFENCYFDEIIIDEAQDLDYATLMTIKQYAKDISYGADFNQQLYSGTIKSDEIENLFPLNRPYNLQENFRNSFYILNFIKSLFFVIFFTAS